MSYRERSIYSHRASLSGPAGGKPSRGQDPSVGDGGLLRTKKKPGTREKERDRDKKRAVTAVSMKESTKPRKTESLDPKKRLKGKKASKSSIQLKRESLEQPELKEIYAAEEVEIPTSTPARVNPYQKYQELIDELNRKYEHEQTLEKIYHRHIEFSVDMGPEGRQRRPRPKTGALCRTEAIMTSTFIEDELEMPTLSGRQSVVELRYEEEVERGYPAEGGEDHVQGVEVPSTNTAGDQEAVDSCSDGTGECDSTDVDDTLATYDASSRRRDGDDVLDPYRTVTFDDFDAFARTSQASADLDLDTRQDSQTSFDVDRTAATSTEASFNHDLGSASGRDEVTSTYGGSQEDGVDTACVESEEDDVNTACVESEEDEVNTNRSEDAGDDVEDTKTSQGSNDGVFSFVDSEDDDQDREDFNLEDGDASDLENIVNESEQSGHTEVADSSDEEELVDSEDGVDVEGGGDLVCGVMKEEGREETLELASDDVIADAVQPRACKSTTSLPSSVLAPLYGVAVSHEVPPAVQPKHPMPGSVEGGRLASMNSDEVRRSGGLIDKAVPKSGLVNGAGRNCDLDEEDTSTSYQRAQRQISALQAQVAMLRADKVEEAHRRVRAATWMRHVVYVESRLRAELVEVGELWRRLQPLNQIARHWEDSEAAEECLVWPPVAVSSDIAVTYPKRRVGELANSSD